MEVAGQTGEAEIYDVTISTPDGRSELYRTTELHPFWAETGGEDEQGGFVAAGHLRTGDQLRLADGSAAYVNSVEATGEIEPVYNFSVEGWHTYHVGELGVWVHNTNCADVLRLRQQYARSMTRPDVESAALRDIVATNYRQNAKIGVGSTADAIRHERATGELVGDSLHSIKGENQIVRLERWLGANPNASFSDRSAAEHMIMDMRDALGG